MLKKLLIIPLTIILLSGCGTANVNSNDSKAGSSYKKTKEVKDSLGVLPKNIDKKRVIKATITSCYDGDTCTAIINSTPKINLNLRSKERLRFLLVDSSEIKGGPMPYAEEARERLNELVKGKKVFLEIGIGQRDKYGRLLVYGFLQNGDSIQETMLKEGLVVVRYIFKDKKYLDIYKRDMEAAKSKGIGVWSIPGYAGFDKPYNLDAID